MVKKASYTAYNVAKYFIYLASREPVGDNNEREGITNLKLQKVLYFAQAYYLAKLNRALFSDKIEAWKYGPVIPGVYKRYKSKKSNPIILQQDKSIEKITEQYYFHLRVEKKGLFRVFGYQKKQFFCITHIDPNGNINH